MSNLFPALYPSNYSEAAVWEEGGLMGGVNCDGEGEISCSLFGPVSDQTEVTSVGPCLAAWLLAMNPFNCAE